jgi:hypothetical protein
MGTSVAPWQEAAATGAAMKRLEEERRGYDQELQRVAEEAAEARRAAGAYTRPLFGST